MPSIRFWLLGHILLVLLISINCTKFYYVQLVKNIVPPKSHESRIFDYDDKIDSLYDTSRLLDGELMDMCREATHTVNEKIQGAYIKISEGVMELNDAELYAVDITDLKTEPKLIVAFKCSTTPPIYLSIRQQNNILVVSIFVKQQEIKFTGPRIDEMCYAIKIVNEIFPAENHPWLSDLLHQQKGAISFDSSVEQWTKTRRLDACRNALLKVEFPANTKIKLLENVVTDIKILYYIIQPEENSPYGLVKAFRCPTIPTIYLEIQDITDNGNRTQWIWVIAELKELFQNNTESDYRYMLEMVQSISLVTDRKFEQLESEEFDEQERLRMCRKAFQQIPILTKKNVHFLRGTKARRSEFWRVSFKTGRSKDVLAFKCPTNPPIYLSITYNKDVWVLIEDTDGLSHYANIVGYSTKTVRHMIEVPPRRLEETPPTVKIKNSIVDVNDLTEKICQTLCGKAVSYVKDVFKMNVQMLAKSRIGLSKYYTPKMDSTTSLAESIVQAFKCPTNPEIYLHMNAQDSRGYILWIYIKEFRTPPAIKIVRFETKLVEEVTEVSETEVRLHNLRKSKINTDALEEEHRRRWCRNAAVKAEFRKKIIFLENTDTEMQKFYALDRESEDERPAIMIRTFVEAFKCPTEPAIYLHINDHDDDNIAWIIIEKNAYFPVVDFLTYNLKLVQGIDWVPSKKIDIGMTGTSRLGERFDLNTASFPAKYRRQLCEKALETISDENVKFAQHGRTEESSYYTVTESEMTKPKIIIAFKCSTEPPIHLEVIESDEYEAYSVIIYGKKSDFIRHESRLQHTIKYVNDIKEAPWWAEKNKVGAIESSFTNMNKVSVKKRIQMCREALKQLSMAMADTYVELLYDDEDTTIPQKFYELSEEHKLESIVVPAFKCPTDRPIYLHVLYKESVAYAVWIIVQIDKLVEQSTTQRGTPRKTKASSTETASTSHYQSDDELHYYKKIKYVQDINRASHGVVSLMPSSHREQSMIDSDEYYSESQRIQICQRAKEKAMSEDIRFFENNRTGRSQYFVLEEGFVGENFPEFKLVRAFECPTKPLIYIEVRRYQQHKRITVTGIIRENNAFKSTFTFIKKSVETITSTESYPYASRERSAGTTGRSGIDTIELTMTKRTQLCNKASKAISGWRVKVLDGGSVGQENSYIIKTHSLQPETVRAFECPTHPTIYLEIHCHAPGDYTVSIISKQPRHTSMSSISEEENVNYKVKYVTDITEVTHRQIRATVLNKNAHLLNPDFTFTDGERLRMCHDATKLFPKTKFTFPANASCDITKIYILNAVSGNPDYIKAFKCPTTPEIYIQLQEESDRNYTAWAVMAKKESHSAVSRTFDDRFRKSQKQTSAEDRLDLLHETLRKTSELNFSYVYESPKRSGEEGSSKAGKAFDIYPDELMIVDRLIPMYAHEFPLYNAKDIPQSDPVEYTQAQREEMCEKGLLLIPGYEFIEWLDNRHPGTFNLYKIFFETEIGTSQIDIIMAFQCPTNPPIYIQTNVKDNRSNKRITRVIIRKSGLPAINLFTNNLI